MDEEELAQKSTPEPEDEVVCEEGAPEWVVTFGDMMSLLLTFFILLLSFAQMEMIKYKIVSGSVMRAFGVQEVVPAFNRPQAENVIAQEFSMAYSSSRVFDGMRASVTRHASPSPKGRVQIEVFEDYRGIVLVVDEDAMFEPGRSDIRPAMWPFLDEALETAQFNRCQIQVEAHTDSVPLSSPLYPSHDHLAAERAVSVVRYFQGRTNETTLPAGRLEAVPYGSTRPKVPNISAANRRRNRRVEIVFSAAPRDFRHALE